MCLVYILIYGIYMSSNLPTIYSANMDAPIGIIHMDGLD